MLLKQFFQNFILYELSIQATADLSPIMEESSLRLPRHGIHMSWPLFLGMYCGNPSTWLHVSLLACLVAAGEGVVPLYESMGFFMDTFGHWFPVILQL